MTDGSAYPHDRLGQADRWLAPAVIIIVWLVLWQCGYPKPNGDDGFFSGAAIQLAEHSRLSNPWITGWLGYLPGVSREHFFVQPPLYPLMMAAWFKCFGISAESATAFACALSAASCLLLWSLLRTLSVSRLASSLTLLILSEWLIRGGLRPEPATLFWTTAGQWAFLRYRTQAGWFFGSVFSSLAVICHPAWLMLVGPATLAQIAAARHTRSRFKKLIAPLTLGVVGTATVFVAALGRNFPPWWHDFYAHARFVAPGSPLRTFAMLFSVGYEFWLNSAVLGSAAIAVAVANRAPRRTAVTLSFVAMGLCGIALYPAQATIYTVLLAAVLPLLLLTNTTPLGQRVVLYVPAILMAGWGTMQHALQAAADAQHDDRPLAATAAAYVREVKPDQVLFDAGTLRGVFDFHPPAGAVDLSWAWSPGREDRWRSPLELGPRDLWVITPAIAHRVLPDQAAASELIAMRHRFHSVRSTRTVILVVGSDLPPPIGIPWIRSGRAETIPGAKPPPGTG